VLIVGLITVVMAALVGWGRSLIFIPMAKGEDDRRYRDGTRQQKQLASWEPKMRPAIVAFAFGVLIFFASSAALALEPPLEGPGHLSLLMLATLAALTGLISIAGAAPFRERRWGAILG
jgi:hypothetical protein